MPEVNPKDFLDDQFPVSARQVVPTVLQTAYKAIRLIVSEQPIFQVQSAKQDLGRMMSYAVDRGVETAIENGSLPFDYSWEDYARPTGKYLAIRMSHSIATISLVQDPTRQPRSVTFRDRGRRLNNQLNLLEPVDGLPPVTGLPHLLLLHGYLEPQFAHLAIPKPDDDRDFSYRTDNLFKLPHEVKSEGPPPEDTDVDLDALVQLKDDIDKWRKDNG